MTEEQTDQIAEALKSIGENIASEIRDSFGGEAPSGLDFVTEALDGIARAVDRHAEAVDKLARALDMDCLMHALCMGIRHGLFGASADSDASIEHLCVGQGD